MSVSKKLYKMQSSSFVEESTTVNNSTSKSVQSSQMSEHKEEVSSSAAGRAPMLGSSRIGKSGSLLDEMGFGSGGSMLKGGSNRGRFYIQAILEFVFFRVGNHLCLFTFWIKRAIA